MLVGIGRMVLGTSSEIEKQKLAQGEERIFDGDCECGCIYK